MPHSAKSITIIGMIETRRISTNFRTILQNLRTTSLGQNLLVLIKKRVFGVFWELFLTVVVFMSTFKNKNSIRTTEDQIVQKLKNSEARPKFTGSYKKTRV